MVFRWPGRSSNTCTTTSADARCLPRTITSWPSCSLRRNNLRLHSRKKSFLHFDNRFVARYIAGELVFFRAISFRGATAMIYTFSRKLLLAAVIVSAAGLIIGANPLSIGQEKGKQESKEKKKGKLPAYYGDLVSEAQRQQIYAIQEAHEKKIAAL